MGVTSLRNKATCQAGQFFERFFLLSRNSVRTESSFRLPWRTVKAACRQMTRAASTFILCTAIYQTEINMKSRHRFSPLPLLLILLQLTTVTQLKAETPGDKSEDPASRIEPLKSLDVYSDFHADGQPVGPLATMPWIVVRKDTNGTAYFHGPSPIENRYSFSTTVEDPAVSPLKPGNALELVLHGWDQEPADRNGTFEIGLLSKKDEPLDEQLRLTHCLNGYSPGISFGKFSGYYSSREERGSRMPHVDANWKTNGANHVVFVFSEKVVSLWINGEFVSSSQQIPATGTFAGYSVRGLTRTAGVSRIRIYAARGH